MKLTIDKSGPTGARSIQQFTFNDLRGCFRHLHRKIDAKKYSLDDLRDIRNFYSSFNNSPYTFRGFHRQTGDFAEAKIMACISGSLTHYILKVCDNNVLLDVNELSALNGVATYIPRDCFSAFLTLEPNTTVIYLTDADYSPNHSQGIRWDDPLLNQVLSITKPLHLSSRDKNFPDYDS